MKNYLSPLFRDNANLIRRRKQIGLAVKTSMGLPDLRVSGNGRYLLYRNSPWLMVADSPQGMIVDLSLTDAETYLANRQGYGINCIQVHLTAGATFGGRADRSTYDDIDPFSTPGDISTPNETYFARVDAMIALARKYEIFVILTAAEHMDSAGLFSTAGVDGCRTFGRYLGDRYHDKSNIIWNYGNDYISGLPTDTYYQAVVNGIRDRDPYHLHTVWFWGDSNPVSRGVTSEWDALINLDLIYSYHPPYHDCVSEYGLSTPMPIFLGESNYEDESINGYTTTAFHIRKQNYWSLLSGACGITYCNDDIWKFASGWSTRLDSHTGLSHTHICADFFNTLNWWLLVPDTTSTIITAGRGTYAASGSIDTNDYAACAYIEGSLAIIYMPTNRTMTVDMTHFTGNVTCRWFDPTDGSYAADAASPHANSGTHDFSHAGTNAVGGTDWVLLLEA